MTVSRETRDRINHFHALVVKWNPKINLVASSTLEDFTTRHVEDCLQLAELAKADSGDWVDMGSGGGFPGIVVAIAAADTSLKITLMESDLRKTAFLRTAARELGLGNVQVVAERIEISAPSLADHISARALAPLPKLLGMVHRHLKPSGTAWLMKGRSWREECEQASAIWQFDSTAFPSRTDPEAAILKITGVSYA